MKLPIQTTLILCLLIIQHPLRAMEFKLPNPSLQPAPKAASSAPATPAKWKRIGGKPEDCLKWVGKNDRDEEIAHVAISKGATLTSQFDIPALTDKEKKAKGGWSGILSLDHYGFLRDPSASSRPTGVLVKLELLQVEGSKKIATVTGRVGYEAAKTAPQLSRHWHHIPAETMAQLEGSKVELRLTVIGSAPVVVSGVSLSRIHSAPSSKLFGRSNGGTGPDLLGVGSLGFRAMTEHRQNTLSVISVSDNGPAAKAGLKAGDIIIGVNRTPLPVNDLNPGWAWFYNSHEAVLGRAVQAAWSAKPPAGRAMVSLQLFRNGKPVGITCKLSRSMDFTKLMTSPDKSALHAQMISFLREKQKPDGSWGGAIRTTFAALALLATQDPAHAPRIKKAVDWMLNKYPEAENFGNLGFWHGSYAGILYCEYYLASGDKRVLPRIAGILDWIRSGTHTSKWGMACLGHGVGGLPYGQKALVAPACHALLLDALAEKCGIRSGLWDTLLPYMEHSWSDPKKGGHGSLGYNASYKDKGQFWSRSGLFAMAAHLRGERADMEKAMTGFMRGHYPWFRNSHAYGEPGGAWGLLALNLCEPEAFNEVCNAYGWWFALAWEPAYGLRFTTPHMGAPYMGSDDLINPAYALVFAAPKKSLFITGGNQRNWLDVSSLETRLTKVIIRRTKDGKVTLACRIPGPEIRYTLDGSEPQKNSPIYKAPFDCKAGATVKASPFDSKGNPGELSTAAYPSPKSSWKVIAASGHQDPGEAIRRASYAIDHSPALCWLTDVGQGAKGFPHFIVIDLGREMKLSQVTLEFMREASAAQSCVIKASSTLKETPEVIAEAQWKGYLAKRQLPCHSRQARYLRIELDQPAKAGSVSLAIREIDVNGL